MLDFSVSIIPFFAIAFANFLLSWVYYSPANPWFKIWAKGVGMDYAKKEMTEEDKKKMPGLMIGGVVASFLLSYGLQIFIHSLRINDFLQGVIVGLVAWFVFVVSQTLNSRFEGRDTAVILINNVLYIFTYALFGGIIAVWK